MRTCGAVGPFLCPNTGVYEIGESVALKVKPTPNVAHLVEKWLDTLTPQAREEAIGYLSRPEMYGAVSLAEAFRHDGFHGTEGAVQGWRRRNL